MTCYALNIIFKTSGGIKWWEETENYEYLSFFSWNGL